MNLLFLSEDWCCIVDAWSRVTRVGLKSDSSHKFDEFRHLDLETKDLGLHLGLSLIT